MLSENESIGVVLLQLTVLVIFGPRGLKGMRKHCIFEHVFQFVKQIWPKPSVVVTLQVLGKGCPASAKGSPGPCVVTKP
jgi:hypothetical protein